jgi:hypothetical protein
MKQCKIYQVNKTLKSKRKAPVEITPIANHSFDKFYLVIVGPLPPSATGNRYTLTFQDVLNKYVVATPINQLDAQRVARTFVSQIVLTFMILTHRGHLIPQGTHALQLVCCGHLNAPHTHVEAYKYDPTR